MTNLRLAHFKDRLHQLLDVIHPHDPATKVFNGLLFSLIALNVIAAVVESAVQDPLLLGFLLRFEQISMLIFTLEYVARIWTCHLDHNYAHPIKGRIRFMFKPLSLVDLLTILPFWLHLAGINITMLRMLRVFRLLKFARLVKYSKAYRFIADAVLLRKDELIISFVLMFMTLLVASSLMYYAESHAQPEVFSSIPASFWWAIVTFTTVGYGDAYPITMLGKTLAAVFVVVGISIFALPTSILTAAMLDQMQHHRINQWKAVLEERDEEGKNQNGG